DQLYTGRGQDGENYQIGFVDICDRPYPEMVAAARRLSARLYVTRSEGRITQPVSLPVPKAMTLQGPFPKVPVDALGRRSRPLAGFGFFGLN
ncbi:MAG: hypothetical protein M3Y08_02280, partial [Fibrobacterota bacterium]|nr:hypothetical protein [Fibrobacterota bacterium]